MRLTVDPEVEGAIGEMSTFLEQTGIYAEGVHIDVAALPDGWKDRLVGGELESSKPAEPHFLEPHDLAVSKLAAGRPKDHAFVLALIRGGLPVVTGTEMRSRFWLGGRHIAVRGATSLPGRLVRPVAGRMLGVSEASARPHGALRAGDEPPRGGFLSWLMSACATWDLDCWCLKIERNLEVDGWVRQAQTACCITERKQNDNGPYINRSAP